MLNFTVAAGEARVSFGARGVLGGGEVSRALFFSLKNAARSAAEANPPSPSCENLQWSPFAGSFLPTATWV